MRKRVPLATAFLTSFMSLGAFSSLLALSIAELTATVALAQTESFYKNKTIKIIVGSTPGGFYDRWARLLAQYMPRHIPGNPYLCRTKHAWWGVTNRGKLSLPTSQTRRTDTRHAQQQYLYRSTRGS